MIPWLTRTNWFPPVETALIEPNGLLAAGGDLSAERLLSAYRRGIFPWYSPGEPLLWWSPDPRMVLFPSEVKISRSLNRTLKSAAYEIRLDSAFAEVMAACAAPREEGAGTWISAEMQTAYRCLNQLGYAHSVETWVDLEGRSTLVGGLYGVAIGRVFYGESMFSRVSDASKIALAHLCRLLERRGFVVIDCQMTTAHLASLGAREIPRQEFVSGLAQWTGEAGAGSECDRRWPLDAANDLFRKLT
ncbi:MAG: leucyl/phenylalanyl-tRNA--protein transferase [Proteobacteria bacterium]|nr:leucyl/phenylalanyl-tRNA--protein transferase [Pseudomonadota bacterium]